MRPFLVTAGHFMKGVCEAIQIPETKGGRFLVMSQTTRLFFEKPPTYSQYCLAKALKNQSSINKQINYFTNQPQLIYIFFWESATNICVSCLSLVRMWGHY